MIDLNDPLSLLVASSHCLVDSPAAVLSKGSVLGQCYQLSSGWLEEAHVYCSSPSTCYSFLSLSFIF